MKWAPRTLPARATLPLSVIAIGRGRKPPEVVNHGERVLCKENRGIPALEPMMARKLSSIVLGASVPALEGRVPLVFDASVWNQTERLPMSAVMIKAPNLTGELGFAK